MIGMEFLMADVVSASVTAHRLDKCNACYDEFVRVRQRLGEGFPGRSTQVIRAAQDAMATFDQTFR